MGLAQREGGAWDQIVAHLVHDKSVFYFRYNAKTLKEFKQSSAMIYLTL